MNFKQHLEKALFDGSGELANVSSGSWIYSIDDIDYNYAGIRPLQHTGANMDRFINDDISTFGIIEGYHPAKILEWAVFLEMLPPDIKWVLAVSAGEAADFFAPYFPPHDFAKEIRPIHLISFGNGMSSGLWKDLFVQRFTSVRTPVYYTKLAQNPKCQKYINMRVLTAIADDIAIMSGTHWDALHTWTADQRRRFANVVVGSNDIPLPEQTTILEAALAVGFDQLSAYREPLEKDAAKIPGYESCVGAFKIWEDCLDRYTHAGYAVHSGQKGTEALIKQAEKLLCTTQVGPMLEAFRAGVPIEDVVA